MAKAKRNFKGPLSGLKEADRLLGEKRNRDWHWFSEGDNWTQHIIEVDDDDLPSHLIECGRLIRLHIRAPSTARTNRHPRRRRDTKIEFSAAVSKNSHVAFDPNHRDERLYLIVSPQAQAELKKAFWDRSSMKSQSLNDVAEVAGGRHGQRDYPDVLVKPLGVITAVVYRTRKSGDENPEDPRSYYIHKLAEITGKFPFLCVDDRGRLWFVGGNYTSPTPGITD